MNKELISTQEDIISQLGIERKGASRSFTFYINQLSLSMGWYIVGTNMESFFNDLKKKTCDVMARFDLNFVLSERVTGSQRELERRKTFSIRWRISNISAGTTFYREYHTYHINCLLFAKRWKEANRTNYMY